MKRKICVVITARPSYSRIKTALEAINTCNKLELQLVVAASALLDRYGAAVNIIENDGFNVNAKVYNVLEGENLTSMAKTTGIGVIELSTVFDNIKPDFVVTIADRFETIATAISAAYMNIPLVHIQGGEVTGNIDEKVRHAISKLSDFHFVSSERAKERLIKMGEEPYSIYNTGCPSIDLASKILNNPEIDFNPFTKYGGVGKIFDIEKDYIVVMQHPVTNEYNLSKRQIEITLDAVKKINLPTFWFWPNIDAGADGTSKGLRSYREKYKLDNIHFFKNMEPNDFLRLLFNSKLLIGNSSVGIRECSFLGVPVVNIGSRQNGRDRANNVLDVDYCSKEIVEAAYFWLSNSKPASSNLYGNGKAGTKIADLLTKIEFKNYKKLGY